MTFTFKDIYDINIILENIPKELCPSLKDDKETIIKKFWTVDNLLFLKDFYNSSAWSKYVNYCLKQIHENKNK